MYHVLDSTGHVLRLFGKRKDAETFRAVNGRFDWKIEKTNGKGGKYNNAFR